MKLGSLFDGSGGFPLAGSLCGIEPVWAAEVEPYPIAVTRSRFPHMKHLGDVTKVNGAGIEPVDIITFGSPCQDLSVAGKRAGLKHESNGDDETTRSGLFMEAIRIIKEMRGATNGVYPRFAVWENVFGAFSSNGGWDFHTVLTEFIRIKEPNAVMPPVPVGGWSYADVFSGSGWSIAYRTFDAQYWGVPQRRRRIYLVADFTGGCAGKILFESEGLSGYSAESFRSWQRAAGGFTPCVGAAGFDGYNGSLTDDTSATLGVNCGMSTSRNGIVLNDQGGMAVVAFAQNQRDEIRDLGEKSGCLAAEPGMKQQTYVLQGSMIGRKDENGPQGSGVNEDISFTLDATDRHAVAYGIDRATYNQGQNAKFAPCIDAEVEPPMVAREPGAVAHPVYSTSKNSYHTTAEKDIVNTLVATDYKDPPTVTEWQDYIVRRLTPTECARLQGFPDKWGHPDHKEDFTDEEYNFWMNVRNTYAAINGKAVRQYTKKQMLAWYSKLHTDSAEYKMWGNGIALPCALYVMQGIADAVAKLSSNFQVFSIKE